MKKKLAIMACILASVTFTMNVSAEEKVLRAGESFAYDSLDANRDGNFAWFTHIYGITESLFEIDENFNVVPCLAESAEVDESGLVWTIKLKEEACFSNGTNLTADLVVKNFERAGSFKDTFALNGYQMDVVDDKTFTITTPTPFPTLINTLAASSTAIIDVEETTDFDNAPIGTGPFVIKDFQPMGDVTVERNENYWDGDVKLDGAVFYYMQEDDPKLMAMQAGELDCYNSVSSAAREVYEMDPDTYNVVVIPATRVQFYVLNQRLSDNVRAAVNLIVDKDMMASFLGGTTSPAVGPFKPDAPYGQVTVPAVDVEKAKELIEADGYTLNADGMYEKDGEVLTLDIYYYAARQLDTLSLLMQEQLKAAGIASTLNVEEDPDVTYMATGDYDIGWYCCIADKDGDPYNYINGTYRTNNYYSSGYGSEEMDARIDELGMETDSAKRAEIANELVQKTIDDNAFGYVGLFNKVTVLRQGVTGFAEYNALDFYGIDKDTDIQ